MATAGINKFRVDYDGQMYLVVDNTYTDDTPTVFVRVRGKWSSGAVTFKRADAIRWHIRASLTR
jgi:hypothetical protein